MIPGKCKSDLPNNITGIDKIHVKCNCVQGSIVNGVREHILYSFPLDQPPGCKINKELRYKLSKKINKPSLSHMLFYLEVDDYKPLDFNGKTIIFTCQRIKI